jgi:hypothetical protein
MQTVIELIDLPKVSLNDWYSGGFWGSRKKMKDNYYWLVKSQYKRVFSKTQKYFVKYHVEFKKNPLDASNTIAMVKLIEDILFESDGYKIVRGIEITSDKGKNDKVTITVDEL